MLTLTLPLARSSTRWSANHLKYPVERGGGLSESVRSSAYHKGKSSRPSLTPVSNHPVKLDGQLIVPLVQHPQGHSCGETGAATAADHEDSIKRWHVGERAIGTLHGSHQTPAWIGRGKSVEVAGEPIVRRDHELVGRRRDNGEGMHLKEANAGDPDKAVGAGRIAAGALFELDAGAAFRKGVHDGFVVDTVKHEADEANGSIKDPEAADDAGHNRNLLGDFGLVQADEDDGGQEEDDVHEVKQLVGESADDEGGRDEDEHGEAGDYSVNLFVFAEALDVVGVAKVRGVGARVENDDA